MFTIQEMQQIINNQNVIFNKSNCPFCIASQNLFEHMINSGYLDNYKIYTLNEDFDNQTLTDLVSFYGWQPDGVQGFCSKPQIFVQGQYIGGNFEFYNSKWNVGEGCPKLKNPMRF